MKNAIVLVSGGVDSVTLLYYLKNQKFDSIECLFFDHSQNELKEELHCVKNICKRLKVPLKIIDLKSLKFLALKNENESDLMSWYLPNRNAIFLMFGLGYAEFKFISTKKSYDIYIGIKSEGEIRFKDTTKSFLDKVNELGKESVHYGKARVIAPFIDKDKEDIVKLGKKLKVPWGLTYSCYKGGGKKLTHCGKCAGCEERKSGFYWANVKDKSVYLNA